jgi:hypothetical protein
VNGVNVDTTKVLEAEATKTTRTWDLSIRRGGRLIQQRFRA